MKTGIVIILLLFTGLSAAQLYGNYPQSEELRPYLESYTFQYSRDITGIPVRLVDNFTYKQAKDVIGFCYTEAKVIEIKRSFWDKSTDTTRTSLLFHELGHCDLNRLHDDNRFYADKCPMSIMTAGLISDICYLSHKSELIQELIDNKK